MEYQKLVELLRSDHDCDTCGFMDCKHDICLMDAMAADAIENLQTENAALRRATDALTDAQVVMVKEFTEKLEELTEVKAGLSWISVKDRLPERTMPPHDVLVYHDLNCGMYIDRAWYSREKNKWRNVLGMNLKVTHWMPLPEPPEKEEKPHEKTDD